MTDTALEFNKVCDPNMGFVCSMQDAGARAAAMGTMATTMDQNLGQTMAFDDLTA